MNATSTMTSNALVGDGSADPLPKKKEDLSTNDGDEDDSSTSSNSSSSSSYDESPVVKRPSSGVSIPANIRQSAAKLYGFQPPPQEDSYSCSDDDDDDSDSSSSSDGSNMLSRAMQGMQMQRTAPRLPNGLDLLHGSSHNKNKHHNNNNNNDDEDEDSSSHTDTDYGYDDDNHKTNAEEEPKVHYRRRNSCLIQEGQDPFSAAAAQDSLLNDGPPLMSDRDLEFEQERKAELVIAMYNQ